MGPGALAAMGQHKFPNLVTLLSYLVKAVLVCVLLYCLRRLHLSWKLADEVMHQVIGVWVTALWEQSHLNAFISHSQVPSSF